MVLIKGSANDCVFPGIGSVSETFEAYSGSDILDGGDDKDELDVSAPNVGWTHNDSGNPGPSGTLTIKFHEIENFIMTLQNDTVTADQGMDAVCR